MDSAPPYGNLIIDSEIPLFPDLKLDYGTTSDFPISVANPKPYV